MGQGHLVDGRKQAGIIIIIVKYMKKYCQYCPVVYV